MRLRLLLASVLIGLAVTGWLIRNGTIEVPRRMNPWAPLVIADAPNLLTRHKLARLSKDSAACRAVLATTDFQFSPIEDRSTGPACGFSNAVRIDRTSAAVGTGFAMTCRAAVSLALWERHVLQPNAERFYGAPVTKIEHFGSYSCRNVYGRANATRSRHATAEALDVAGFVLSNGKRVRIVNDWASDDAQFLRSVRDGACQFFDGVLSPDYNAAHRDHFHFDRGPYRTCR